MSELTQLDRMEALLVSIDRKLASGAAKQTAQAVGEVATDADLDSKYGDEEFRKMPSQKYWQGDDYTGKRMSQVPADFLDAYAKYKDACAYMNEKSADPEKAKYIGYDRKSAGRARGWAKRIRDGKVQQVTRSADADDIDSCPF